MTYNPDEPRDAHGRWTAGSEYRQLPIPDASPVGRAGALLFHAFEILHEPTAPGFDREGARRLLPVVQFFSNYRGADVRELEPLFPDIAKSLFTLSDLRMAAWIWADATTLSHQAMADRYVADSRLWSRNSRAHRI